MFLLSIYFDWFTCLQYCIAILFINKDVILKKKYQGSKGEDCKECHFPFLPIGGLKVILNPQLLKEKHGHSFFSHTSLVGHGCTFVYQLTRVS